MPEEKEATEVQETKQAEAEPNGEATAEPKGAAEDAEYWKSRSRSWERQFKELRAEADQAAEAGKRAADEAKRADEAQAALDEARRKLAAYEAAERHGVDPSTLLRMSGTAEDMESNAEAVAEAIRSAHRYPEVPDNGQQNAQTVTVDSIESEADPVARVMKRAENISLYN